MDQQQPAALEGPGGDANLSQSLPLRRLGYAPHPPTGPSLINFAPDGVIGVSA